MGEILSENGHACLVCQEPLGENCNEVKNDYVKHHRIQDRGVLWKVVAQDAQVKEKLVRCTWEKCNSWFNALEYLAEEHNILDGILKVEGIKGD